MSDWDKEKLCRGQDHTICQSGGWLGFGIVSSAYVLKKATGFHDVCVSCCKCSEHETDHRQGGPKNPPKKCHRGWGHEDIIPRVMEDRRAAG